MPKTRTSVCWTHCQMAIADDFCSGKRTAKNLMSDVDSQVKQYKETFNQLRLGLQEHAVIHTEITVLRVLDAVGDLCEISELGPSPKLMCLATSRGSSA